MINKLILALFVANITSTISLAQKKQGEKYIFSSRFGAGLLEGQTGSALQLQTIHGLNNKGWFMGAGVGLDYYNYRSIPLFLSFKRDLKPGSCGFFVQADVGLNIPWTRTFPRWDEISSNFKPGLYWHGGLGYAVNLGSKKNQFLINLGYSYKHAKEIKEIAVFCINPPCPPMIEEYNYHLRRISLGIAWQFMVY